MSLAIATSIKHLFIDITKFSGGDFGEQFNNAIAAHGKERVTYVATGVHTLTTSVDLTDSYALHVDLRGAWVHINAANIIGFDCTDVEDMIFEYGQITGDSVNTPYAAILHGDSIGGGVDTGFFNESYSERNEFNGGTITGYWKYACWLHHGREISKWTGYNTNEYTTGYAMAIFRDSTSLYIGGSPVTVTSPYKGSLASGGSPTKTWVDKATLFSRVNKGDGLLMIQGSSGNSIFNKIEFRSLGEPCVAVYDDCGSNYVFDRVSTRMGFDADYPTDSGCNFLEAMNSAVRMSHINITGEFSLRHATGGTPGYIIANEATGGVFTDVTGDVRVTDPAKAKGILTASRGIQNYRVRGADFEDGAYINSGENYIESATGGTVNLAASGVVLIGIGDRTITKASGTGFEAITAADGGVAKDLDIVTTTSGAGINLEGPNTSLTNINVNAAGDGILFRGDGAQLTGVNVTASGGTALRFDAGNTPKNGSDNSIIGGDYTGNVLFETASGTASDASNNRMVGSKITGNVTFQSGTDNNKLVGCVIDGNVTFDLGSGAANELVGCTVTGSITDNR